MTLSAPCHRGGRAGPQPLECAGLSGLGRRGQWHRCAPLQRRGANVPQPAGGMSAGWDRGLAKCRRTGAAAPGWRGAGAPGRPSPALTPTHRSNSRWSPLPVCGGCAGPGASGAQDGGGTPPRRDSSIPPVEQLGNLRGRLRVKPPRQPAQPLALLRTAPLHPLGDALRTALGDARSMPWAMPAPCPGRCPAQICPPGSSCRSPQAKSSCRHLPVRPRMPPARRRPKPWPSAAPAPTGAAPCEPQRRPDPRQALPPGGWGWGGSRFSLRGGAGAPGRECGLQRPPGLGAAGQQCGPAPQGHGAAPCLLGAAPRGSAGTRRAWD